MWEGSWGEGWAEPEWLLVGGHWVTRAVRSGLVVGADYAWGAWAGRWGPGNGQFHTLFFGHSTYDRLMRRAGFKLISEDKTYNETRGVAVRQLHRMVASELTAQT